MKWLYEADPFAAREARAAKKREIVAAQQTSSSRRPTEGQASGEFSQAPEVRMAGALRELVEDAIKKVRCVAVNPQSAFLI